MLPLAGIRIIDIGTVAMAPYASQWLADFGADVIKVEPPEGDQTRRIGPAPEAGMAAMFLGLNRSKRSVVLDLTQWEARGALDRLIAGADVVMHNIRPQKLAKLGIDPAALLARDPRLIFASLQGFAEEGPYGGRPAYDDIVQGLSGIAELVRLQTGTLRYAPTVMADKISGLVAANAITAALVRRGTTGEGGLIEVPMFETMVAFNLVEHFSSAHFGGSSLGYERAFTGARGPYRTADGHISFMPYTDRHWRSLFAGVGREDLAADERFATTAARTDNITALYRQLGEILSARTTAEWLAFAEERQIPAAPVLSLAEIVADPHLAATGFFAELDDESIGRVHFPGVPVSFDGQRPGIRMAPRLGEHSREVLAEAGLSDQEIDRLVP